MSTILMSGGTGMIGTHLQKFLTSKGYHVIVLMRDGSENKHQQRKTSQNISYAKWNVEKGEIDNEAVAKADYVIHLAGANVASKRWTSKRKKEIVESRTKSSALLIKAMQETSTNIKAVVSASAVGWYGKDTAVSKQNGFTEDEPAAKDFLGKTCQLWEGSIKPVTELHRRLIIFRFGVVMSEYGGALKQFRMPLKLFVAAILGNGKQIISWIHIDDLCRLLLFAMENENMSGVYNAVAPEPVTNKELTLTLAKIIRGKAYIPVHIPAFVLKLMLGKMSTEILKSATVSDEKVKHKGFNFNYPDIKSALENCYRQAETNLKKIKHI